MTHHTVESGEEVLELERYLLGELPPEHMGRVSALEATDPVLQTRLEALRRSAADIVARHPAPAAAAGIRRRLTTRRRSGEQWWPRWPGLAASAAASIALVLIAVHLARPAAVDPGGDRTKAGGPALVVYRWAPEGPEVLTLGATAGPGDLLRIGYKADGRRFGVILSSDGSGVVTQHLPASGERSAELSADALALLDMSFELDAAPSWERFYFVTSDHPFDVDVVRRAVSARRFDGTCDAAPGLELPGGLGQVVFSIKKRDSR